MNYLENSISGYRAAHSDRRELIFFALWGLAVFLKFFGLECEVWGRLPRAPLAYALSASLCAAFAAALSLLPRRLRFACAIALDLAFSALAVTDVLHIRFFRCRMRPHGECLYHCHKVLLYLPLKRER